MEYGNLTTEAASSGEKLFYPWRCESVYTLDFKIKTTTTISMVRMLHLLINSMSPNSKITVAAIMFNRSPQSIVGHRYPNF